ncbi:MAG: 1-acyl-sn-glycerol-3-phosphate acyltransferase [Eubacterium sp.]|nr:1-acyl-sn-glycerol-3-phosphate acyltransferase [Eubacterium sp.]
MRTILMLVTYLLLCILSIPLLLMECVIRKIDQKAAASFALRVVRIAFHFGMFLSGCKKEVLGIENIPADTPVMFAANHRSFYDIILAYAVLASAGVQAAFVSKIELKRVPMIAQWMYFLNCLFMDRGDMKQNMGVILNAIALIKEGYSIYIAPEGTRNATDTLLPFKEGSMKIATKTNAPIVPVCIKNTENILENHLPWIRGGHISIEFGKPVYVDTLEKEEKKHIGSHVQQMIQEMYDQKEIE